jgi:hypothetical protein
MSWTRLRSWFCSVARLVALLLVLTLNIARRDRRYLVGLGMERPGDPGGGYRPGGLHSGEYGAGVWVSRRHVRSATTNWRPITWEKAIETDRTYIITSLATLDRPTLNVRTVPNDLYTENLVDPSKFFWPQISSAYRLTAFACSPSFSAGIRFPS